MAQARRVAPVRNAVIVPAMGASVQRYFIPVVIGFAPVILFLLNWEAENMGRLADALRNYTAPVLLSELFVIVVALREGFIKSWSELRPPRMALIALAVLIAVAVGTAAISPPAQFAAVSRTIYWIVHLLFGFSIAFLCKRVFDASDLIVAYLAGFAALAVAFTIWAAGAIGRPIDWTWDLPSFLHLRHLGIYATPMIALCIGLMATIRGRAVWAGAFLLAVTGFALALWTGSRGPVAAIGVTMVAGAIVSPDMRRPAVWVGVAASLAVAAFIVALLPVPAPHLGVLRTVTATTQTADMTTGRTYLWSLVAQAIEQRPLFGYGEGQMKAVAHYGRMAQPHNIVLQVLLAWGIVGLICSLVLAYSFVRMAVPVIRRNAAQALAPILAMISLLALSMLDAALYHILPLSIFAACAGMIAASRQHDAAAPPQ